MTIDFRKEASAVRAMLERCVTRYSGSARSRVAKPFHPPVTRIDIVFTLGDGTSTPYIILGLDTKPGSQPDGNPTHPLFDILYHFEWGAVVRYLCERDNCKSPVIFSDGSSGECNLEQFTQRIGDLLVETLTAARDQGVFRELPKGERCEFGVEELGGEYGWPNYEDRGKENLA